MTRGNLVITLLFIPSLRNIQDLQDEMRPQ